MTEKEKAKQLVDSYIGFVLTSYDDPEMQSTKYKAKKNALICVDEIINQWEYVDAYLADLGGELNPNLKYWYEVRQEIEKL